MNSPPGEFSFSGSCPLCGNSITATGETSEAIRDAKKAHLRNDHPQEELLQYFLADRIIDNV